MIQLVEIENSVVIYEGSIHFCWDSDTDSDKQTEIELYMARKRQICSKGIFQR